MDPLRDTVQGNFQIIGQRRLDVVDRDPPIANQHASHPYNTSLRWMMGDEAEEIYAHTARHRLEPVLRKNCRIGISGSESF